MGTREWTSCRGGAPAPKAEEGGAGAGVGDSGDDVTGAWSPRRGGPRAGRSPLPSVPSRAFDESGWSKGRGGGCDLVSPAVFRTRHARPSPTSLPLLPYLPPRPTRSVRPFKHSFALRWHSCLSRGGHRPGCHRLTSVRTCSDCTCLTRTFSHVRGQKNYREKKSS